MEYVYIVVELGDHSIAKVCAACLTLDDAKEALKIVSAAVNPKVIISVDITTDDFPRYTRTTTYKYTSDNVEYTDTYIQTFDIIEQSIYNKVTN